MLLVRKILKNGFYVEIISNDDITYELKCFFPGSYKIFENVVTSVSQVKGYLKTWEKLPKPERKDYGCSNEKY